MPNNRCDFRDVVRADTIEDIEWDGGTFILQPDFIEGGRKNLISMIEIPDETDIVAACEIADNGKITKCEYYGGPYHMPADLVRKIQKAVDLALDEVCGKKTAPVDDHEGMIYNPITDTWNWF